jgi:multidrug efflux pump subunit AcrA (membrane-fusion protein)
VILDGRVSFVAMLPDQTSRWTNPNMRLYGTEVVITTPYPGLRPGMSCSIEILVEELADALYVPVQAVHRERKRNLAFVSDHGRVEQREVKVGRFNELWVQVLEGLKEGEIVLLHAAVGFAPAPDDEAEAD